MQSHDLDHRAALPRASRWYAIWAYARDPATWVLVGSAATALALAAGLLYILWWLLSSLFTGLGSLGGAAVDAVTDFAEPVVRTITDPVHSYIHTHADQLPIAAGTLWWSWIAISGGMFALAALGSHGARIGWTAIGAVTTALVWAGAEPDTRMLTAAITAAVWAVLSLIAFNGIAVDPDTQVVVFRRDPATPDQDT